MINSNSRFLKKILLLLSFSAVTALLSGCWDRWEINDLALVTAAAIDQKGDDQIELSLQIFIPKAISSGGGQGGSGSGDGLITLVKTHKGANMADALSKVQAELPRRVFWGQCKIFIFGEEAAKKGIQDHLDFLLRHPEPRERAYVFVSDGKAKKILELQSRLERSSAETMRELVELNIGVKTTVQDLNETLTSKAQAAALPFIKIATDKKQIDPYHFPKIIGSAIFKEDKMTGFISDKETRGLLWIRDEVKGYTVTIEPKKKNGQISLSPVTAKVNLTPQINGPNWIMNIKIETEGTVVQNDTDIDLSVTSQLQTVEKAYQEVIKKRLRQLIDKAQKDLNADILGFSKEFHRKYPKNWSKVENNWDNVFPEVKINFVVTAHIRREGYINKPTRIRLEKGNE
ncbi:Ger(x)C family spore germination protein [Bacillus sp. S/N-304-OC-R1]|uniref:Ger(x)C family spore germination protein n=1 Tax=Bacillus sp. S/N-304-OC-R1 TaxID=2758034 RepID=UPI001C8D0832|nr:Ger(x)C family spore germination protein [Bacillus sp. S/N-304-OC-R1]MBY0120972.1 Ger(x)C family spore germination protein [Bacillus sp. S/N-304-OC-R1]